MAHYVTYGVSPRASIYMIAAAQALALVRGREYLLPEDVRTIAPDVLRHRLVLSYEALGDDVDADDVVTAILARVPMPEVVLRGTAPESVFRDTTTFADSERLWKPPPT
jgi:MoxR-like ATPase